MSQIVASFPIPFIQQVTMPAHWARWLSGRGRTNSALRAAAEGLRDMDPVTWDYNQHGLAPWMQFFYDWRFADLTGDGQIDMLMNCGAKRQIAYRWGGEILWDYHDPDAMFMDIRLDTNFPILDIDGDGHPEMVCARKIDRQLHLSIVNARTGETLRSIPFPALEHRPRDFRASILIANLSGGPVPSDILVSWDYGWIGAYDKDLNLLWERELAHEAEHQHVTMGHTPYPGDIDSDGRDEIMVGSCLINSDGSTIWVADDHPALLKDGHADSVLITHLEENSAPVVLMSTGAYCFSSDGTLLWGRDDLKHGQALRVGKIRDDTPDKQVLVYEAASRVVDGALDRVIALDYNGKLLWDFSVQQPDMQEGGFGFWLGDWTGDGLGEVFLNDPKQVNILNGFGEIVDTLPGHLIYVFDLVDDKRVEAVTLDKIAPGMNLHIWGNNQTNKNVKTNQLVTTRKTTKAMYNCTRY